MMKLLTCVAMLAGVIAAPASADTAPMTTPIILQAALMHQLEDRYVACAAEQKKLEGKIDYGFPPIPKDATTQEVTAALDEGDRIRAAQTKAVDAKANECLGLNTQANEAFNNLQKLCRVYSLLTIGHDSPATAADLEAIDICNQLEAPK
ncbi:MAG TPA: hypothetical protein VN823_09210 [Stellaceae bacterium]|nr:hypothetical protein [Stellaceae bacterium]